MDINAPKYDPSRRAQAIYLMQHLRDRIVLPDEAEKGFRFKNDSHVLWVLESQATEAQFTEDPVFHATAALIESAKSDYWYNHEKDYDWPELYEDCDTGGSDE